MKKEIKFVKLEKRTSPNDYMDGYKSGQRHLANRILESSMESVGDLGYWLAKLKAIQEGKENEFV